MLVAHPHLRHHREAIAAYHAEEACHGSLRDRTSMLLGLGELGGATTKWLTNPELGVRVGAALAPALAEDETATNVLRSASLDPAALDSTFGGMHLHQLPWLNQAVAETLCDRFESLVPLLDSAIAAVAYEAPGGDGVLSEPYLRKAFPLGLPVDGTNTQRALARMVADHDRAWRGDSRWAVTFARIKLPVERQAWLASAGDAARPAARTD